MVIDYIDIARELISLQQHLQADLPYHINLVDAIGADENANSRILAGILSYHDAAGNYDVLKDFADHFFPNTNLGIKMFTANTTASEGYGKFITLAKTIIKTFQ